MPDHELSQQEKKELWIREQLSQIPEMRTAIDNLWQHIAFLARAAKITPKQLVRDTKDFKKNYTFLQECVDEENKLQAAAKKKAELAPPSAETSAAIEQLTKQPT